LSTAHLVRAFFGLNSRFNHLLCAHFQNHEFNLQSIAKDNFDVICQQHLPIFINNIISLHLSNDIETPNLCELFLSYGFTLDRFIHLKSLSLYHIDSDDTINGIIIQCHHLSHLNHLNLINCYLDKRRNNIATMIDNIWSLPKLTHCTINDIIIEARWLYKLSVISSSIEFLSIKKIDGDINILYYLFKYLPCLQRLNVDSTHWMRYDRPGFIFSSLISLKTSFANNAYSITDFLTRLPNLCYLTLETSNIGMNGYDWEKLLVNHLPKIKIFHLKMTFDISSNENIHKRIDELVDSFRTHFWLEEHQWYVQCDCYSRDYSQVGVLYTLPYAFNNCSYLYTYHSRSTKPDEENFSSYKYVQFVEQNNINIDSFNDLIDFNSRFPNIRHLRITLPLINDLNSCNLLFNQLTSFNVILSNVLGYSHLQTLLNQLHHLYSLKLCSFGGSVVGLFQLTSSSVRRLDLIMAQVFHRAFFSNEDCFSLINSPLGRQCEVLLIEFENRRNILDLIDKMPQLRVLIFRCKDIIRDEHRTGHVGRPVVLPCPVLSCRTQFPFSSCPAALQDE
jgi:hypothetical protein